MKYLSLDPGHSTGWATFKENGDADKFGTVTSRVAVYDLLREQAPDLIIMEDWITKQGVALGGDKLETVRVIGAVEFYVYLRKIPLVLQPNTVKSIAYKWAGMVPPKRKSLTHEADAYVHGVYYLQKQGIRRPQQGAG